MKIKSKRSFAAIIGLLLVIVIGVTFAVIYSSSTRENLFGIANYSVITSETFESPTNWLPGETIDKTIYAMNNGDVNAAYRVKIDERWEDASGNDITSSVPSNAVTINFINQGHWNYNSTDGYYYHKYYIKPGTSSCSIISGVTLNEDLMGSASCEMTGDTYNCTSNLDGLAGAKYILTFTKETVAYEKYQSFWNTNEEITEEPLYTLPYGRTESNLQVGDEICVNGATTECFNFIKYDGNNIVMLAEYNLNVGEYAKDEATNLQDSDIRGFSAGGGVTIYPDEYGGVAFSGTNYWDDNGDLKSKYGEAYYDDNNIYDTDYSDASGTNYSVAYYVENYKDILENYGLTVQGARLLTYSEATDSSVGCDRENSLCPVNEFITNTSFWLGSAGNDTGVYGVFYDDGGFFENSYDEECMFGVRPVIVVAKSGVNGKYTNAEPELSITIPSGRTRDNLQVGDEICVNKYTSECFNFIRYDGDNVVMLSKYNLNVGSNAKGTATNLQDSDVKGYVSSGTQYGNVAFSGVPFGEATYWVDSVNNSLKSKYGSSYPADVYDTDYSDASGTNYTPAYYVENYKDILENYGLTIQSARLLTYSEATNAGCSGNYCSGFIINTSFWFGTAYDHSKLWTADTRGRFAFAMYDSDGSVGTGYGVRPVIVINKNVIG